MTAYQDVPFYHVDSPLNQPDEEWWVEAGYAEAIDPMSAIQRRMMLILSAAVLFFVAFGYWAVRGGSLSATAVNVAQADQAAPTVQAGAAVGGIAPLFTREVQHWAPQIVAWAAEFGLDPNMVATVMQIESCGDPNAVSGSGAQGLFQVMPFHFSPGEQMQDPDTNARRGMAYLALGMEQTGGDTSRTFAGYNGGHGTAARSWETWPAETQRYYVWSTGIYEDAVAGNPTSDTLDQWLAAGGAGLCQQAAARLGLQ
jgi:soluble lytic murein transglycosylase-like protein